MIRMTKTLGVMLSGLGLLLSGQTYGDEPAAPPAPDEQFSGAACDVGGCDGGSCDGGLGSHGSDWCCLSDPYQLFGTTDCGFTVGGWTQVGYHSESNGMFNNHDSQAGLHQQWLYVEKVADGSCGWDFGGRVDLLYGLDAQDTQAFGNPPGNWDYENGWDRGSYGWAMPQLYLEAAYGDWNVKVGHFFTLVGYEVVSAPDNFFYSHSYTMYNSEPFTHTGVISTYTLSDNIEVYSGWTAGWDTGFDRFDDGSNFLGGVSIGVTDNATLTYITTIGDFGFRGEGYSHSVVLDTAVTDAFHWIIQSDLVETNGAEDGSNLNHQYGLNQYFIYTINDCLGLGARAEWWKNNGASQYEVTVGANIRPHANLVIRPEIRHDWNPADQNIVGKDNFTTVGVDAILTY